MPCLESTWNINKHVMSTDVMVSWTEIKIACLVSWSIIIKIVSNSENNGSSLIELEFYSYLKMRSCFKDL